MYASAPRPLVVHELRCAFRPRTAGESERDPALLPEATLRPLDEPFGHRIPIRFAIGVGVAVGARGSALTWKRA